MDPAAACGTAAEMFVIEEDARGHVLHLASGGLVRSWALPGGISLDPADPRPAVEQARGDELGAGAIWDHGTWRLDGGAPLDDAIVGGRVHLVLIGRKLKGGFVLALARGRNWQLAKRRDRHACRREVTRESPAPVSGGRVASLLSARAGLGLGEGD